MAWMEWVDRFAVWEGIHPDVQTLLTYAIGIAIYTVIAFAFYQPLANRTPYHTKRKPGWRGRVVHALEDIFIFPLMSMAYFGVLSLTLFFLAKSQTTAQILLLAMAVAVAVRVTAHVHPLASVDLAKLLPWALFGFLLVDPGALSLQTTFARIGEAALMLPVLVQYFVLFILVEGVLRAVGAIAPTTRRLAERMGHKRHLSKRAMLRDIEGEHDHGIHIIPRRSDHHEHAPRDRSRDFLSLDERIGGKPGSAQGVGPAIQHELKKAKSSGHAKTSAHHAHKPRPSAGPGGKGGTLAPW